MNRQFDDYVPYLVHESDMARQERTIKRLCVVCLVLILALIGTNAGWIYYESQWQYVESQEVTQHINSDNGNATINDGIHINGTDNADGQND